MRCKGAVNVLKPDIEIFSFNFEPLCQVRSLQYKTLDWWQVCYLLDGVPTRFGLELLCKVTIISLGSWLPGRTVFSPKRYGG